MRKRTLTFVLPFLALVGFSSCSDDDNGPVAAGRISFYGDAYPLGVGAIYHDDNHTVIAVTDYTFVDRYEGENGGQVDEVKGFSAEVKKEQTGNFLVALYEPGFILNDLTKDARGSGAAIWLRLASPETDRLVPGKYTYSLNKEAFTFKGNSGVNYSSGYSLAPNELTEGEVNISCEGEEYTVTFDCKTSFGGAIQGSYTGELKSFDIRKDADMLNYFEDVKLEALFDKVKYMDADDRPQCEPDYIRAASFFKSSAGAVYTAYDFIFWAESAKKGIDIALAYDREKEAVYFESPIRMRALLWHNTFENYNFNLPCHTKYMLAPADFTDADFDALAGIEDFAFDFAESEVSIPVTAKLPVYVFVQTANGVQGVLRIKGITPEDTEMIEGITYPLNPAIVMDTKFPRSFSEQIR